jgi:hypothetical protein
MQRAHAASVNLSLVARWEFSILPLCRSATLLQICYSRNLSRFGWLTSHDAATMSCQTGRQHRVSKRLLHIEFGRDARMGSSDPTSPRRKASLFNLPGLVPGNFFCPVLFGRSALSPSSSFSLPCKCDLVLIATVKLIALRLSREGMRGNNGDGER